MSSEQIELEDVESQEFEGSRLDDLYKLVIAINVTFLAIHVTLTADTDILFKAIALWTINTFIIIRDYWEAKEYPYPTGAALQVVNVIYILILSFLPVSLILIIRQGVLPFYIYPAMLLAIAVTDLIYCWLAFKESTANDDIRKDLISWVVSDVFTVIVTVLLTVYTIYRPQLTWLFIGFIVLALILEYVLYRLIGRLLEHLLEHFVEQRS